MFATVRSKHHAISDFGERLPFRRCVGMIVNVVLFGWIAFGLTSPANASPYPFRSIRPAALPKALAEPAPADGQNSAPARQQDQASISAPLEKPAAPAAPSAPTIIYQDGQLTINAENALLSDVLSQLHSVMGAEIDLPSGASSERVWVKVGPGPARKVVGELLSGTDLNYVIQGSATDANGIGSVLLTMRSKGGPSAPEPVISETPVGRLAGRSADRRNLRTNPVAADPREQENSPSVSASAPAATSTPAAPDAASASSSSASPDSAASTPPPAGTPSFMPQSQSVQAILQSTVDSSVAHPSPPPNMTQEEVTQELQSLYKQRMQMQQNVQNPQQNR